MNRCGLIPGRSMGFGMGRRGERGTTLVEVGVSLVVFLAGILGALSYFSFSQISLHLEGSRRAAAQIAHARLEELRTVAYDDLPLFAEEDTEVVSGSFTGTRRTIIEDVDDDGDDSVDYRRATVEVTWSQEGRDQTVRLVTLLSPYR